MCKCVERNSWNIRYEIFRLVYALLQKIDWTKQASYFWNFFAISCQIMFANFSSQLHQLKNKTDFTYELECSFCNSRYYRDKWRLKCTLRYLLVGLYCLYSYLFLDDGFFAMYRSLIIIAPYDFLNYTLSIKTGRLMLKLAKRFNENYFILITHENTKI